MLHNVPYRKGLKLSVIPRLEGQITEWRSGRFRKESGRGMNRAIPWHLRGETYEISY